MCIIITGLLANLGNADEVQKLKTSWKLTTDMRLKNYLTFLRYLAGPPYLLTTKLHQNRQLNLLRLNLGLTCKKHSVVVSSFHAVHNFAGSVIPHKRLAIEAKTTFLDITRNIATSLSHH